MPPEHDAACRFFPGGVSGVIQPLGRGLINDSFLVTANTGHRAVLQRINRHVFPRPEWIMENLSVLAQHVRERDSARRIAVAGIRLPEILKSVDGRDFIIDAEGGFWRALEYIEGSRTVERIEHISQAAEVGAALGRFHALTHDLDPARLRQTLPGFHDTPGYFKRFLRASARPASATTDGKLMQAISFVEKRWKITRILELARRQGKLVSRPIHGDTKLNNFLFDEVSGKVVSLIDLDTVQPGLIQFDIGDCLRSCANTAGESPEDIATVHFDPDIAHAILRSYLTETRDFLTPQDGAYLYEAIRLVPFELGLRFLTDHLEGDRYFKTEMPGHNLHRSLAQFQLTASIEEQERSLKALIAGLMVA